MDSLSFIENFFQKERRNSRIFPRIVTVLPFCFFSFLSKLLESSPPFPFSKGRRSSLRELGINGLPTASRVTDAKNKWTRYERGGQGGKPGSRNSSHVALFSFFSSLSPSFSPLFLPPVRLFRFFLSSRAHLPERRFPRRNTFLLFLFRLKPHTFSSPLLSASPLEPVFPRVYRRRPINSKRKERKTAGRGGALWKFTALHLTIILILFRCFIQADV